MNALDFNAIAANFGGNGKVWLQGDFTYDGLTGMTDFTMLSKNFNQSLALPAETLGTLVPEPGTLTLLAACVAPLIRRRRR